LRSGERRGADHAEAARRRDGGAEIGAGDISHAGLDYGVADAEEIAERGAKRRMHRTSYYSCRTSIDEMAARKAIGRAMTTLRGSPRNRELLHIGLDQRRLNRLAQQRAGLGCA